MIQLMELITVIKLMGKEAIPPFDALIRLYRDIELWLPEAGSIFLSISHTTVAE